MSQVLSRRLGALLAVGGLTLTGLTACSSSKSASAAGSAGSAGGTTPAAAPAASCPALGAAAPTDAPKADGSGGEVTIYSADGLYDTKDDNNWYNAEFKKFTALTGIHVNYSEDGSGGVEAKVDSEKANPKADVIVTLPPFIQKAQASGLLQAYSPACVDKVDPSLVDKSGQWEAVMGNYLSFIYNTKQLPDGPPKTWNDLLDPKFAKKLQYSTPGVAGDGTAVMIKAIHDFGSRDAAWDYFKKLQANNVGPSKSTGKLESKVNTGDLLVANGDVQMNYVDSKTQYPNTKIFFLAGADGKPTTFSLPYMAGLVKGAPHADNGKKLIDFLLSEQAQLDASKIAYGFPARTDVKPADDNFASISGLLQGVTVFPVDWNDVAKNYNSDVKAWDEATGTPS
ncbi:2-aminoethylphosphonate ABC transporter substrate-binding protein [Catenulispora subtropica]|uniref:2-aminoethylphosphonate ABC transporter substrate-binding protein n=1 Tax=Catenulispora subtropica TaxID=450798 RepID=A0ABP5EG42_9ACTN